MRRKLFALVLVVFAAVADAHDKLGANLNFIGDFRRNHEFVDVVKQSRRFLRIGQFDDQQTANLAPIGADGWPTTDFRVLAMAAQRDTLGLAGTYKIVFNGQATLSTGGGAGTIANPSFVAATNTSSADLVFPAGAELMTVDFAATGGSVKNVRILRPGYDAATAPLLHTPWKDHAKRFPVLRFLDWTRTNGNRAITWADRTTPEKLRTEAYIAQWETVIDAANSLGRDPWINIPVQANDEYVTNLATLLRDRLATSLNVYVEYGNELWNFNIRDVDMDTINGGVFIPATVNRDLAVASPANSPLRFDGESNAFTLGYRRVALRLKEVSDIFKTVWGASAINTRVRPILAGQMANSFIVSEGLRVVDEGLGLNVRPNTVFYGLSGAPYIFAAAIPDGEADEVPGMTVQQILAGINAGVANAPADNAYQYLTHAALGAWYGLKVVAYEAGFDNFGGGNVANKRLANLDPAIRESCKTLINQWHSFGFEHILWFNAGADGYDTSFGMWPLVEDMTNQATPKNQCMDDILAAALPAVTAGTAVTGASIAGGNFRGSTTPTTAVTGAEALLGFPGFVEYLLRADAAGSYGLAFTGSAPAGESFRLKLNNATVATSVTLPVATGASAAFTVALRKGLNALRVERNGSGSSWSIASFAFTVLGTVSASPASIDFGGQSMRTTAPSQPITLSNPGTVSLTITSLAASNPFGVSHNCAALAAGASCVANVTFTPTVQGAVSGTLTVVSSVGTMSVTLAGTGEKSLVTHYYRSILRRAPDAGGKQFWDSEAARVQALGVNVNEVWFALAGSFYSSAEYLGQNRDNAGFVTDLYGTFFNRAPDAGGFSEWTGLLAQGMPREVVLASFMFSSEFATFTQAIFGTFSTRKEIDTVVDFYRGLLARLPDGPGFNFWLGQFRTAQCQGSAAVISQAETISSLYARSEEYTARNRSNAQFVGDLYNAFLRRGGDLAGVQFWISELATSRRTRENVRQQFVASPEFSSRVSSIIAQGCIS